MAIGYMVGGFFDPEDPIVSWTVTGVAIAATFALLYLLGRYVRREADRSALSPRPEKAPEEVP